MIFFKEKIASLEKDVEEKRNRFFSSTDQLAQLTQEKTKPIKLFIQNRKMILGTVLGFFSGLKIWRGIKKDRNSKKNIDHDDKRSLLMKVWSGGMPLLQLLVTVLVAFFKISSLSSGKKTSKT